MSVKELISTNSVSNSYLLFKKFDDKKYINKALYRTRTSKVLFAFHLWGLRWQRTVLFFEEI